MTDQEKMMEFLKMMSQQAAQDEMQQMKMAATAHQRMINAYMQAGFTRKEAIQVTTQLITASLGTKK